MAMRDAAMDAVLLVSQEDVSKGRGEGESKSKNENDCEAVGIITAHDIANRVVAQGVDLQAPAYQVYDRAIKIFGSKCQSCRISRYDA